MSTRSLEPTQTRRLAWGATAACWLAGVSAASGQVSLHAADLPEGDSVAILVTGAGVRLEAWRARVVRAAHDFGARSVVELDALAVQRALARGPIARDRVEAFRRVEALLLSARRYRAALDEPQALAQLGAARRLAEEHADVAGSVAWLAEVEAAIAVTAAQAGLEGLATTALAHAAAMDPDRGMRAAEAPPDVQQMARRIEARMAARPLASFEVVTEPAGALLYVDDELLGPAPRRVRVRPGRHALRVERSGWLPYGRLLDVPEGPGSTVRVRLAPGPELLVSGRAIRLAGAMSAAQVRSLLERLELASLWLTVVGDGSEDRALLTVCSLAGCGPAYRLERHRPIRAARGGPPESLAAMNAHRRWLNEPAVARSAAHWWQRWYVWTLAGVVALAAGGVAIAVSGPEPERRRRFVIDGP